MTTANVWATSTGLVPSTLAAELAGMATAAGWTHNAGLFTSPTVDSRQLRFTYTYTAPSIHSFTLPTILGQARTLTIDTAQTGGNIQAEMSVSSTHFYLDISGPGPGDSGAPDAIWGSYRRSFAVTHFTPYITGENLANAWCALGHDGGGFAVFPATDRSGLNGWPTGSVLATMRPCTSGTSTAVQASANPQMPSSISAGSYHTFPFVLVSPSPSGIRGRLESIEFVRERTNTVMEGLVAPYLDPGDLIFKDGETWRVVVPHVHYGTTTSQETAASEVALSPYGRTRKGGSSQTFGNASNYGYTSLGYPAVTANAGGPLIAVRWAG